MIWGLLTLAAMLALAAPGARLLEWLDRLPER